MNPILEALGDAGYLLDTPGAYLRGALAGKFGERASGDELLNSYGFDGGPLGGMATEFLLDPLGMPGLALGASKGLRGLNRFAAAHADDVNPLLRGLAGLGDEAGVLDPEVLARRFFGGDRRSAQVAAVQGPGYPGGAEKLADMLRGKVGAGIEQGLLGDPLAAKYIASEIPEGSSFLGKGAHGVAFATPYDSVIRVSRRPGELPVRRYEIPEILQPFRSVYKGGHTVEHLPRVRPLDALVDEDFHLDDIQAVLSPESARSLDPLLDDRIAIQDAAHAANTRTLRDLDARGFEDHDWDLKNVGLTDEGRLLAHDPSVVAPKFQAVNTPKNPVFSTDLATPFRNDVRRRSVAAGAPDYIRDLIEMDAARGARGQGVPAPEFDAVRDRMDRLSDFLSRFPSRDRVPRADAEAILRQFRG